MHTMSKQTKQLFQQAARSLAKELATKHSSRVAREANEVLADNIAFALSCGKKPKVSNKDVESAIDSAVEMIADDDVMDDVFDEVQRIVFKVVDPALRESVHVAGTRTLQFKVTPSKSNFNVEEL